MTHESMNIHKALSELKILDDRIEKLISETKFVTAAKHSEAKLSGMTVPEFVAYGQSQYQKICDLIRRRDAIKQAVSDSNAHTTVTIGGKTYSVAVAIAMKQSGIEMYESLLRSLKYHYNRAVEVTESNNAQLEVKADAFVANNFGRDKETQANADVIINAREAYIAPLKYEIVDTIQHGVPAEIQRLQDFIDGFKSEVDAALSTSNATTEIEIEY